MLSFNCQVLFFYVRGEMMHKTERRIHKMITILMTMICGIFFVMCITAYISLGKNLLPKLFTLRRKITEDSKDYMMLVAQVLFTIACFFKISIVLYPAREQIYIYYKVKRTTAVHLSITIFMSILVFAVPCVYPDVTNLLGLLGGITIGTSGYSIPLVAYLASLKKEGVGLNFCLHALLLLFVVSIQIMSTYISLAST